MEGVSFVTPVTGLSGPDTRLEDDDDDVYVMFTSSEVHEMSLQVYWWNA
jgi:hypothetical protein